LSGRSFKSNKFYETAKNMINKINKERRRSMNATPTQPINKNQWQGAKADPKQKQDRAQGRARTESHVSKYSKKKKKKKIIKEIKK
jgi:hypothetical protein